MQDAGRKKIQVIKAIRQNTGLGLKESKDLVDQAPSVVLANVPEDVASSAAATLTAAGAEVFIQAQCRLPVSQHHQWHH
ncbi:MAG TPA: ribosomal protein L7/L12 [Trebonia sp.]